MAVSWGICTEDHALTHYGAADFVQRRKCDWAVRGEAGKPHGYAGENESSE